MAVCITKQKENKRVCIGALNKKIIIYTRALTPKSEDDVDFDENFSVEKTVWALIETVTGKTMFDSSNQERVLTHYFYIRYISGITIENWLKYNNEYYEIINVENFNEDSKFYKISTQIRGLTSKNVNLS